MIGEVVGSVRDRVARHAVLRAGIASVLLLALFCAAVTVCAEGSATKPEGSAEPADADLEPLKIKLPEPIFMGTPLDYWSSILDITYTKRPSFPAPKGARNVAKGKPVTSSDMRPSLGKLVMITDGNKEAREEGLVELAPGVQYVQIDLEKTHEIYAIIVWHWHAEERVYHDFVVQVCSKPEFKEKVTTLYNNDHDNSSKLGLGKDKEYIDGYEGRLINTKGVKARYVRLYTNGNTSNDMNHYLEVEVFAKPAA